MLLFTRFDVQGGYLAASFSYNVIMMLYLVAVSSERRVSYRRTERVTAAIVIVRSERVSGVAGEGTI